VNQTNRTLRARASATGKIIPEVMLAGGEYNIAASRHFHEHFVSHTHGYSVSRLLHAPTQGSLTDAHQFHASLGWPLGRGSNWKAQERSRQHDDQAAPVPIHTHFPTTQKLEAAEYARRTRSSHPVSCTLGSLLRLRNAPSVYDTAHEVMADVAYDVCDDYAFRTPFPSAQLSSVRRNAASLHLKCTLQCTLP
jgi:hypothetical protein